MGKNKKYPAGVIGRFTQSKTKILIAVVAVALVAAGGFLLFPAKDPIAEKYGKSVTTEELSKKSAIDRSKSVQDVTTEAIESGDDSGAAKIYENAQKAESDPVAKVELAVDRANLLVSAGKKQEAIDALMQAIPYNSDKFRIYDQLARTYEQLTMYSQAAVYYEKAGVLVSSPANIGQYQKIYYDNKVVYMKSLASNGQ